MNLILLGAPGAGKGTQAEAICNKLQIPAVSTGNIIRAAIKAGTETGKAVQRYTEQGQLVPDEVVIAMVKERLAQEDCKGGFILDGFPRTLAQAVALDEMGVTIDKVIDIEVSDSEIIRRMSGRRVCGSCGATYHIEYKPSQTEGVCDKCSEPTILRKDDEPDTVLERLQVYHNQTEPLKEYYEKQNKLYPVQGQEEVRDTIALTMKVLEA